MKELPIIFSAPMVRAILAGEKTQTRRVVKPKPADGDFFNRQETSFERGEVKISPRYQVGTRLWVRETFMTEGADIRKEMMLRGQIPPEVIYRADGDPRGLTGHFKWTPAIFMNRLFSRIDLEATEVRVQKLQEISEEDVQAEGVTPIISRKVHGWTPHALEFSLLWDSINGKKYPWHSNPWVFAYTFKRIKP